MTKLTTEQQELLSKIMGYPASAGAFSGMVFNAVWNNAMRNDQDISQGDIDRALQTALATRLRLQELALLDQ